MSDCLTNLLKALPLRTFTTLPAFSLAPADYKDNHQVHAHIPKHLIIVIIQIPRTNGMSFSNIVLHCVCMFPPLLTGFFLCFYLFGFGFCYFQ